MAVVFPIVMMLLFCSLYAGAYIWMRRPKFGESERNQSGATIGEDSATHVDAHHESNADSTFEPKHR
ncbi:MAG TPA: hypothetical protein VIJ86_10370 [Acidimicrobiales bacterium]